MECLAIGSVPYDNPQQALTIVQKYFKNIPFWLQLAKVSKNEDMTFQFLEGMPSFFISNEGNFFYKGGKIAWEIVPTKDKENFERIDLDMIDKKFKKAVNYLTKKGINEKLIMDNSFITSTCGAGSLSNEPAEKAMRLTFELKERYNDN